MACQLCISRAVVVAILILNTPTVLADEPDSQAITKLHSLNAVFAAEYEARVLSRDGHIDQLRRLAESNGEAPYQAYLGFAYEHGHGVLQNFPQAVEWYRKAAEKGYDFALWRLGIMYEEGHSLRQDKVLAYMLYNLATLPTYHLDGNVGGVVARDTLIKKMTPMQIEEGQELSANWKVGTPLPAKSRTGAVADR